MITHKGESIVVDVEPRGEGRATVKVADLGGFRFALDTFSIVTAAARAKFVSLLPEPMRIEAATALEDLAERILSMNGNGGTGKAGQGSEVSYPVVEPWPEPVDGAELLREVEEAVRQYVILSEEAARAVALWIIATHAIGAFDVAPILCISSPVKRCGKTTLQRIIRCLVRRPLSASNISPAALFRVIERDGPTLLLDEADAYLKDNEELRCLLNAGISRGDAHVIRLVGDDHEPRTFAVFGWKAIALIGKLPDTLEDRSVIVRLERKKKTETVRRLRERGTEERLGPLRAKMARWAEDHREELSVAEAESPRSLNDRASDLWGPLFAIAGVAGGVWAKRAAEAAVVLSGEGAVPDDNVRMQLLSDLRDCLRSRAEVRRRIASTDLADDLAKMEERPWAAWSHGRSITPNQVAWLLRGFDGVSPKALRISGALAKGYDFESCREAFERYLPENDGLNGNGVTRSAGIGESAQDRTVTGKPTSPFENDGFSAPVSESYGVTAQKGVVEAEETEATASERAEVAPRGDAWEPEDPARNADRGGGGGAS